MKPQAEQHIDIEELVREAEQLIDRRSTAALPLAEKTMVLAIASGNPKHFAQAKYLLAFYHCLVANNYDVAIDLCNEVLAKTAPADREDVICKLYMTLGNSYQLKGDVFSAQESYMAGLKQLENRTGLNVREKGLLASFYYNVSLLLSSSELNLCTEEYLQKAIEIYEETGSHFRLSKSYVSYAGILEKKGQQDKAIEFLFKALELDTKANDIYSLALTTANLGILHLRTQKYDEALVYLQEGIAYYKDHEMAYETGMVKVAIGETLFALGQRYEALVELRESETIFKRLENKQELCNVYGLLSKFMEETGDTGTALFYQKQYTESLKSYFDIEKTNSLTRAKKEFETEQREKEAVLLQQKNEEIKSYVHRLEISNNELKQFAHVASHDLREPLRMITSYMGLVKRSLQDNITEQQTEFISFAIGGAKRMELLIIDLLRLAKIDANAKIEKLKLQNVMTEISLNLDVLLQEKNAKLICDELPGIVADRTQILQLFQNIIGNGIKYNENESPTVTVNCNISNSELELTIADNGIGIDAAYHDRVFQIFQRIQTTKEYSGSGIGLTICKKIVDGMNGRISIDSNPGGGSIFKLVFPASILA